MDYQQSPPPNTSGGYGFLGCIAGLFFGFIGGGVLLLLVSLAWATATADPAPPSHKNIADMRVRLGEEFLNRIAQQNATNPVKLDLLPGNQIRLDADTTVTAMGVSIPVNIQGLFGLQVNNQAVELRLIDAQVTGIDLPPELNNLFSEDVAKANQDLTQVLNNLSTLMGVPITLTGLGTTDTNIWLEAREAR
jgi:hypothetical protein